MIIDINFKCSKFKKENTIYTNHNDYESFGNWRNWRYRKGFS